jgi:hypothetical protein
MYVRTSTYDQKKLFANNIGPFLAGKFMPQKDREKAISGHATFKLDSNLKAPPPVESGVLHRESFLCVPLEKH